MNKGMREIDRFLRVNYGNELLPCEGDVMPLFRKRDARNHLGPVLGAMVNYQDAEDRSSRFALRFAIFTLAVVLVESAVVAATLIYLYQHPAPAYICDLFCL